MQFNLFQAQPEVMLMVSNGPFDSFDPSMNKYSLVKGAARRARQLQNGAPPLGVSKSMKACRVAQDEIRGGKVSFTLTGKRPPMPPASM